jgi:hypothetical protein
MKSKSVVVNLKRLFYIAFFIQIAFFVSFAFKWIYILPDGASISVGVETYALLITLIGIPGALKLFSVMMDKNKHPEDDDFTTALYKKAFIARFGILFLIATLNILLYAFSFKQNFMLLTLVTFTAYAFSYPSTNFLKVNAEEELPEQDK